MGGKGGFKGRGEGLSVELIRCFRRRRKLAGGLVVGVEPPASPRCGGALLPRLLLRLFDSPSSLHSADDDDSRPEPDTRELGGPHTREFGEAATREFGEAGTREFGEPHSPLPPLCLVSGDSSWNVENVALC